MAAIYLIIIQFAFKHQLTAIVIDFSLLLFVKIEYGDLICQKSYKKKQHAEYANKNGAVWNTRSGYYSEESPGNSNKSGNNTCREKYP